MRKPTILEDIKELLPRLYDLHHQATVERSRYYVGATVRTTIDLLERLKSLDGRMVLKKEQP